MSKIKLYAEQNAPSDESLLIHEIFVHEGQVVKIGEILFVAEGSKSLFDVESQFDAVVDSIHVTSGQNVKIGDLLLILKTI